MGIELITMLTWNDVTVKDAKEVFLSAKDAPCTKWGFKIEGTTPDSMKDLALCMKENGKKVYIEVLAMEEEACIQATKQCIECGVDHMIGTPYFKSVEDMAKEAGLAYSPFVGLAPDSRLRDDIPSIVAKAKEAEKTSIYGINLSAFRYAEGDPVELLKAISPELTKPYSIAGSVNSYEKMDLLKTLPNLYAFTIGGAFFEGKFGGSFAEQVTKVCEYLAG